MKVRVIYDVVARSGDVEREDRGPCDLTAATFLGYLNPDFSPIRGS